MLLSVFCKPVALKPEPRMGRLRMRASALSRRPVFRGQGLCREKPLRSRPTKRVSGEREHQGHDIVVRARSVQRFNARPGRMVSPPCCRWSITSHRVATSRHSCTRRMPRCAAVRFEVADFAAILGDQEAAQLRHVGFERQLVQGLGVVCLIRLAALCPRAPEVLFIRPRRDADVVEQNCQWPIDSED